MKDSGIEWIGEIPDDWGIVLLSSIFHQHKEKNVNLREINLLSLSYGRIIQKDINTCEGLLPASFETYNIIDDGDIVFRLTDLQNDQRSLRTGLCTQKGIITSAYITLRKNIELDSSYMHYLYHSYDICKVFYGMGDGVRQGINFEDLKKILTLFPSVGVQRKIAGFLEEKCAKIDGLIAHEEATIEELKAYKQSVITEAITRGLDKSMPLKDSGVKWIGQVSQNASVAKIGLMFEVVLGKMITPNKSSNNDTLEDYYCAANVHFDSIDYSGFKKMWFNDEEKSIFSVHKGDLLVVEGGAGAGGAHIIENEVYNCYMQNSIMAVRTMGQIPNKWVYYTLYFLVKSNYIDYICNKATIPHFTKDKLGNTPIVVFSQNDIEQIISYLDVLCSKIDAIIKLKQQKIEELKDYKKSLIYEYVTGKKEVA